MFQYFLEKSQNDFKDLVKIFENNEQDFPYNRYETLPYRSSDFLG